MPAKRKPKADERKQYNVGFGPDLHPRIDDVAEALGLDPTQCIRMIVTENLGKYERRAKRVRSGLPPEGDDD